MINLRHSGTQVSSKVDKVGRFSNVPGGNVTDRDRTDNFKMVGDTSQHEAAKTIMATKGFKCYLGKLECISVIHALTSTSQ